MASRFSGTGRSSGVFLSEEGEGTCSVAVAEVGVTAGVEIAAVERERTTVSVESRGEEETGDAGCETISHSLPSCSNSQPSGSLGALGTRTKPRSWSSRFASMSSFRTSG